MIPIAILFSLAMTMSDTSTATALERLLPPSIQEWERSGPCRMYPGREIFRYIDGAGEVYLAYQYCSVLVQRYARPGREDILVEIFDMATSRNAFGVYTYMLGRGPAVPIGQEGEYKSGLLCFWRDRYCVYIRVEKENDQAREAVLALGEWIAGAIGRDGEKPPILHCLPKDAYQPGSLRYFYRHEILNTHFYVADGNPFLLNDRTECVLVKLNSDSSHLLLVAYPTKEQADSASVSVLTHLLPDARESGIVRTENGKWTACEKAGNYVITVFDAATSQNAVNTLSSIRARLP